MRYLLVTLLFAISIVVLPAAQVSAARSTLYVVGDSITERYNDKPGSADRGWWSLLSEKLELKPAVSAQSGAGYLKKGDKCTGSTFAQQLTPKAKRAIKNAKVVIVAGGRNDYHRCSPSGKAILATPKQLRQAVNTYLDQIDVLRKNDKTVYVATFWGPRFATEKSWVTSIIKKSAKKHGFQWVNTNNVLNGRNTTDGTHPNRQGSIDLYHAIYSNSDIAKRSR